MNLETEFRKHYDEPAIVIVNYDSMFKSVSVFVIAKLGSTQKRSFNVEKGFTSFDISTKLQDMADTLRIYESYRQLEIDAEQNKHRRERLQQTIEAIENVS